MQSLPWQNMLNEKTPQLDSINPPDKGFTVTIIDKHMKSKTKSDILSVADIVVNFAVPGFVDNTVRANEVSTNRTEQAARMICIYCQYS